MDKYFEALGTNTYLSVQLNADDQLDTMSLGMLTNNTIPGFASATFMQMDDAKYIKYNITSKVAVSQLFTGPVNRKRLLGVFTGIVDAMLSAEDYMLDPRSILMDLDYIFTDVSTCETVLICLPITQESGNQVDLSNFLKKIMFTTQFDQTEKCDHVAQMLNYLNSVANLSLSEFKEVLEGLSDAPKPVPVAKPVQPVQPQPQQVSNPVNLSQTVTAVKNLVQPVVNAVNAQVQNAVADNQQTAGFEIPGANTAPAAGAAFQQQETAEVSQKPASEEKAMSWFYLMQHYNKENAALYKAQQEAKKAQKSAPQPKKAKKSNGPEKRQPQKSVDFAVPGDPVPEFDFPIQSQPAAQPVVNQKPAVEQPVSQQPPVQKTVPSSAPINFGQTTILGVEDVGTTVLIAPPSQGKTVAYLVRVKTGEKITISKPTFKIGKERSYVDYAITGNSAVSRSHAMIINRDGEYLIEDTNSTNHTYVDGKMIAAGVTTRIQNGTKLRFADEEFEFKTQ